MEAAEKKTYKKKKMPILVFLSGFIRIRGVVNWLAISFFGFLLGISSLDVSRYLLPLSFFMISTFFILAFTFAINNYYDIDSDKNNPRRAHLNALALGKISKRTGMILNIIFVIIPLILSFFYKQEVILFCFLLIFWMWVYSAPPLRLKGRPGVDIFWHFVAFVALVLWGSYFAGNITVMNGLVAIALGIFGCIAQIDNHIKDYFFDKASGSKTFAVWIGLNRANIALQVFVVIYIIFLVPLIMLYSFFTLLTIIVLCGGIVIGLFVVKIKKKSVADSLYTFIIFFSGSVFINCLISHISQII
jgi:4-hydroxybenzoate polyprenyltransferase